MKHIVGVADMKTANAVGDVVVTYALGSCVGVAVHDPVAKVGGILHFMLPISKDDRSKAEKSPYMFGDTGIPELFTKLYAMGGTKQSMRVVMAGGAQVFEQKDFFAIGKRNIIIARKLFWKNDILIAAEHVGDSIPRTLYLEIGSGKVWITTRGNRIDL